MAAICCTLRLPDFAGSTLDSYIRWHVHIGFEHLFLFVDDPTHDVVSLAIGDAWPREHVTVIRRDAKLKARQEVECTLWGDLGRFYEDEVQARQSLNAELAVGMARARGLRWLLHIDVDELFYTSAPSIHAHFARLDSLGVSQMTYANHEAVPEQSDIGDYFRGATLFRRHHFEVPLALNAREAMQWWERRTNHGQYMLCYDNGKSAARVSAGLVPRNVHTWRLPVPPPIPPSSASPSASPVAAISCTALADSRSLDLSRVLALPSGEPCILHFVVCGLDWFCAKYRFLGNIPSSWFGGALPIPPCFHLDSRDAYLAAAAGAEADDASDVAGAKAAAGARERSAGRAAVRPFFEQQVLFSPENVPCHAALRRAHVDAGVLREITLVQKTLTRLRAEARLPGASLPLPAEAEGGEGVGGGAAEGAAEGAADAAAATAAGGAAVTMEAAAAPTPSAFTYDRAWILAQASRSFLSDQMFGGGGKPQ